MKIDYYGEENDYQFPINLDKKIDISTDQQLELNHTLDLICTQAPSQGNLQATLLQKNGLFVLNMKLEWQDRELEFGACGDSFQELINNLKKDSLTVINSWRQVKNQTDGQTART